MTFVQGSGSERRVGRRAASRSWWTPRWVQRQREDHELARWATELSWQWADAVDNAQLARHSVTAGRIPLTVAPQLHSVDLGPPVTLLVEMLPGQVVDDFQGKAQRIAGAMGVPKVHVELYDPGWIKVVLLEDDPSHTDVPLPA
ncbi:MAG TPA: hypothetical protein VN748_10915 [Pseudonocardiaceae bacterium]|jgi:hypothetical protein|nr:hypothetical protein [Pseudonocardiaceae bacterium]